jgi:hypothetical protein
MEHGTWIGVSLERLAILNVMDKPKKRIIYLPTGRENKTVGRELELDVVYAM